MGHKSASRLHRKESTSELNCAITKKSGFDVLASHDFISLQKMLIIGLHPNYNPTNAKIARFHTNRSVSIFSFFTS
jgi:hypothetical protein